MVFLLYGGLLLANDESYFLTKSSWFAFPQGDSLPGIGPSSMGHWSAAITLSLGDSATTAVASRSEVGSCDKIMRAGGGSFQDTMPSMGGGEIRLVFV